MTAQLCFIGLLAVVLACLELYGLLSYEVRGERVRSAFAWQSAHSRKT